MLKKYITDNRFRYHRITVFGTVGVVALALILFAPLRYQYIFSDGPAGAATTCVSYRPSYEWGSGIAHIAKHGFSGNVTYNPEGLELPRDTKAAACYPPSRNVRVLPADFYALFVACLALIVVEAYRRTK